MSISPEISHLIEEIKNDQTHGASQLARQAVNVLKVAAQKSRAASSKQFLKEQKEIGWQLMRARPAMAPIANMANILLDAIVRKAAAMDLARIRLFTVSKADKLLQDSLKAVARIAECGAKLVSDGDIIMTHSYSSTVVAMLKRAFTEHPHIEVVATRSGAGGSGEITARELGGYGIPVTLIDDTAVGLYIARANKAVIGADRICADGKVVNGVGSYLLAIAAQRAGVPFYVLCESLKFDPGLKGEEVDLEEREPFIEPGGLPPGVRARNPGFDITPLELITGIVTEKGLLSAEQVIGYAKSSPANIFNPDTPGPGFP
jgi:eIF-2B alpha/beta/delta-like uncharacterized protein